jgi:dihydroneopterin aldolase
MPATDKLVTRIFGCIGMNAIVAADLRQHHRRVSLDIVFIEDLRIETIIGIYDWEREIRQVVAIDLEMAADNTRPAASESIDDALNYKAVAKRLIKFVGESEFLLVETLAERIAEIILSEFNVPWLRLKLSKPGAVTGSKAVGVVIERGLKPE